MVSKDGLLSGRFVRSSCVEKRASREKIEGHAFFFAQKAKTRTSQNTKRRLKNGTGEKNRRRHARVGDVSRVTDGAFPRTRRARTEMRETRQQVRLRDPVTLLLVPRRGRGVSAGGVSRRGATARDGVRADHDARARASRDARVKNLSASTRRVEGLEKYRRVDVAIAVSRAVGRERCAARGRVRGRRKGETRRRNLTRSPIQSVRTSPSPVVAPFADILAAASQTPVANEDASTRATFISVSPCFGRWRARGRGPRKRARRRRRRDRDGSLPRARAENASSSRASRVPVRGSSAPSEGCARSCSTTNHEGTS